MAHDTITLNITLTTTGEEYDLEGRDDWSEHYHNNQTYKQDVVAAVKELLENTLANVMVNGVGQDLSDIEVSFGGIEVHVTDEEQERIDDDDRADQDGWDAFHAEIDKRTIDDGITSDGIYSIGDLSGPISQLDEVVCTGPARVAITDGWDDNGPVYSDTTIVSPTNWQMFKMFCEALNKSNDHHHIFLERLAYMGTDDEGVATYQAITGS